MLVLRLEATGLNRPVGGLVVSSSGRRPTRRQSDGGASIQDLAQPPYLLSVCLHVEPGRIIGNPLVARVAWPTEKCKSFANISLGGGWAGTGHRVERDGAGLRGVVQGE